MTSSAPFPALENGDVFGGGVRRCHVYNRGLNRPLRLLLVTTIVAAIPMRIAVAAAVSEDVPVPGGRAALAAALGIRPVPDRARFVSELARLVHGLPDQKAPRPGDPGPGPPQRRFVHRYRRDRSRAADGGCMERRGIQARRGAARSRGRHPRRSAGSVPLPRPGRARRRDAAVPRRSSVRPRADLHARRRALRGVFQQPCAFRTAASFRPAVLEVWRRSSGGAVGGRRRRARHAPRAIHRGAVHAGRRPAGESVQHDRPPRSRASTLCPRPVDRRALCPPRQHARPGRRGDRGVGRLAEHEDAAVRAAALRFLRDADACRRRCGRPPDGAGIASLLVAGD